MVASLPYLTTETTQIEITPPKGKLTMPYMRILRVAVKPPYLQIVMLALSLQSIKKSLDKFRASVNNSAVLVRVGREHLEPSGISAFPRRSVHHYLN